MRREGAGYLVEANVDVVGEARGTADADEGTARVHVVLPIVELLVVVEGEVVGSVLDLDEETVGLEIDPFDFGYVIERDLRISRCLGFAGIPSTLTLFPGMTRASLVRTSDLALQAQPGKAPWLLTRTCPIRTTRGSWPCVGGCFPSDQAIWKRKDVTLDSGLENE